MIRITELASGKKVYISGREITAEDAIETAVYLIKTWGNDFEKIEKKEWLMDLALELTD